MRFISLGSSSKGNSYILNTDTDETLIIEAGIKYKTILKNLNFKLGDVKGALITHEHKDHCRYVGDLIENGIDVYASQGTFDALAIDSHRAKPIQKLNQYVIGGFTVLPFDVQHDVSEPLGFLIHHNSFGRLVFATDTFYVKYKFQGVRYYVVECNYSIKILNENIRSGVVDEIMKKRLLTSHFSLEHLIGFFKETDLSKTERIYLCHLSNSNSNAKEFKDAIQQVTGCPVVILDE
jgi:phosphoribosyl 1,2-cyclic phosphodiesterase